MPKIRLEMSMIIVMLAGLSYKFGIVFHIFKNFEMQKALLLYGGLLFDFCCNLSYNYTVMGKIR